MSHFITNSIDTTMLSLGIGNIVPRERLASVPSASLINRKTPAFLSVLGLAFLYKGASRKEAKEHL